MVVVLQTGNPVALPWLPGVKAILAAWFLGQAAAEANRGGGRAQPCSAKRGIGLCALSSVVLNQPGALRSDAVSPVRVCLENLATTSHAACVCGH
jgi:hypothetical protein